MTDVCIVEIEDHKLVRWSIFNKDRWVADFCDLRTARMLFPDATVVVSSPQLKDLLGAGKP